MISLTFCQAVNPKTHVTRFNSIFTKSRHLSDMERQLLRAKKLRENPTNTHAQLRFTVTWRRMPHSCEVIQPPSSGRSSAARVFNFSEGKHVASWLSAKGRFKADPNLLLVAGIRPLPREASHRLLLYQNIQLRGAFKYGHQGFYPATAYRLSE